MIEKESAKYFSEVVRAIRDRRLYPDVPVVNSPSSSPLVTIAGRQFLNFASNNYLGLANSDDIRVAVVDSIQRYGIGSTSSRHMCGNLDIQVQFERQLAEFLGYDACITFSSCYLANVGTIKMLIDPFPYFPLTFRRGKCIILADEMSHASIIDGMRLSRAERAIYKHSDIQSLERLLAKNGTKDKLILTDGVFSMEGDVARLKEISQLATAYGALLVVDDSHGIGVLGPKGEGTAHHLGVHNDIDVITGSFTKAFGSIGGFVATSQPIADYLRMTARSYIFSDPMIPAVISGMIEALRQIRNSDEKRHWLLSNAKYLRDNLREFGFNVLGGGTPIVPLLTGNEKNGIELQDHLLNVGIFAPCVRRPAVPVGLERIRFSIMANHTKEQIDYLLEHLKGLAAKLGTT